MNEYPPFVRDDGPGIETNIDVAYSGLLGLPNGTHKVVPADAIVIERADMPEVKQSSSLGVGIEAAPRFQGTQYGPPLYARNNFDPDAVWANGLAHLALAEHLREHPPVGEREVEALGNLLAAIPNSVYEDDLVEVGQRLLATGKVHVDVEATK